MEQVLKELQELKKLALLGAKQALTMSEAAMITGLSKSHLYKLVCRKAIPYYKSDGGKINYFDKQELTAWQLQHRIASTDEVEQRATTHVVTGKKGGVK